jgi:hypothetical protein
MVLKKLVAEVPSSLSEFPIIFENCEEKTGEKRVKNG